jgi:hypothetical protein
MPSPYSYHSSNPRAATNPLASIPLFRPRETVLGWTDAQKATWALQRDTNNLAVAEAAYAHACTQLGVANRRKSMRRTHVANAFRYINARRAILRAARKALAASQVATAALATVAA